MGRLADGSHLTLFTGRMANAPRTAKKPATGYKERPMSSASGNSSVMVQPIGGRPTRRSFHARQRFMYSGVEYPIAGPDGSIGAHEPNILKLGEVRGSAIQRAEQLVDFHSEPACHLRLVYPNSIRPSR